eukprot:3172886-Alexandrium_andersonii.AAC.1
MSTVPESAAPLGAMSSRSNLEDWLREGHDGRIFTPRRILPAVRSVTIRQGILANADQTRRVEHFRTAFAEAMGSPSAD